MPSSKKQTLGFLLISGALGVIIGLMYLGFEWIVNQGTNLIWNTLVQSDVYRWRVIPLAILLGFLYSFIIKRLHKTRLVPVNTDLASEVAEQNPDTSAKDVLILLFIGILSLVAGASLGPEAPLVAASIALVAWLANKLKIAGSPQAKLLTLTSLGALLCAFLHTLIPVIIPLLLLAKKKQLRPISALVVILCCFFSWGVVFFLKGATGAKFPLPSDFDLQSILIAALLGFMTVILAQIIKRLLTIFHSKAKKIETKFSWIISTLIFGGVLGLLYYLGGPSVQFSGEEGMKFLLENQLAYPFWMFFALLIIKLVATTWSLGTGYRGGLVFPSIYMATALSLTIDAVFSLSGATHTGAIIGGSSGILLAMTNPLVGIVLAFSLFPLKLFLVSAAGALGAVVGMRIFTKLFPQAIVAA